MALEAYANCWTNAEDAVAVGLSNSATLRTMQGAADQAASLALIRFVQESRTSNPDFSTQDLWVTVGGSQEPYRLTRRADGKSYAQAGEVCVELTRLLESAEWANRTLMDEADRWFKNRIGTVAQDLWSWLWDNGRLNPNLIAVGHPFFNPEEEHDQVGVLQSCELLITWQNP